MLSCFCCQQLLWLQTVPVLYESAWAILPGLIAAENSDLRLCLLQVALAVIVKLPDHRLRQHCPEEVNSPNTFSFATNCSLLALAQPLRLPSLCILSAAACHKRTMVAPSQSTSQQCLAIACSICMPDPCAQNEIFHKLLLIICAVEQYRGSAMPVL